jgi:hypothetical protein
LTMLLNRVHEWARQAVVTELSELVDIDAHQHHTNHETFTCIHLEHACKVAFRNVGATIEVSLHDLPLPKELQVVHHRHWGPQRGEALFDGTATPTGNRDFDVAFLVQAVRYGERLTQADALGVRPEIMTALLSQRDRLKELRLTRALLEVEFYRAPTARASTEYLAPSGVSRRAAYAWKFGVHVGVLAALPSASELLGHIDHAVRLAIACGG